MVGEELSVCGGFYSCSILFNLYKPSEWPIRQTDLQSIGQKWAATIKLYNGTLRRT